VKRLDSFLMPVNRQKTVKQQMYSLPDSIYRASARSTKQKVHRR
jgi:hypothetical protein